MKEKTTSFTCFFYALSDKIKSVIRKIANYWLRLGNTSASTDYPNDRFGLKNAVHLIVESVQHMLDDRITAVGQLHNKCWTTAQQLMCGLRR